MSATKAYSGLGGGRGPLRRLLGERVLWALVLSAVALVLIASARTDRPGIHPQKYTRIRGGWRGCADVVLAGDSRVTCGLSPADMATRLPGLRIVNYAFPGMRCRPAVFDAAEGVLDPKSPGRMIVLGVTPASLSPGAGDGMDSFEQMRIDLAKQSVISTCLEELTWHFDAMSTKEFLSVVLRRPRKEYSYKEFHADGWLASNDTPEDPRRSLAHYRKAFAHKRVQQEAIDVLVAYTRRWTAAGIGVCGFRPPTTAEMIELENRLSGFDEAAVVEAFVAAGGLWLDVDQTAYRSYDGSHLRWDAARQFSRDLAELIRARRAGRGASQPQDREQ